MKFENGETDVRTFSFVEWLRTSVGGKDYDYLMLRTHEGDLYFLLKNENESRLFKVNKKKQEESTSEEIPHLIKNGEELGMPFSIKLALGHRILFEKGRMIVD